MHANSLKSRLLESNKIFENFCMRFYLVALTTCMINYLLLLFVSAIFYIELHTNCLSFQFQILLPLVYLVHSEHGVPLINEITRIENILKNILNMTYLAWHRVFFLRNCIFLFDRNIRNMFKS